MTARAAILALAALSACASARSSYQRSSGAPGELVWAFDGELTVTRDGSEISDSSWSGLADALTCVPRAAELAASARGRRVSGLSIGIGGGVAGLAGMGVGSYMAIDGDLGTGLVVLGAGTAVFASTVITGAVLAAGARPRAIDAVNLYNDEYPETAGCRTPVVHRQR